MKHVAIIGAGIGGLAAAMRLAHGGVKVTVLERQATPGGKMRSLPSAAGMIDAGPTVLTMKPVFEALFREVGCQLADYATLIQEDILARHFWRDGTRLDLMRDPQASLENVRHSFGAAAAAEFHSFSRDAQHLFDTLNDPMMQSATPALREDDSGDAEISWHGYDGWIPCGLWPSPSCVGFPSRDWHNSLPAMPPISVACRRPRLRCLL